MAGPKNILRCLLKSQIIALRLCGLWPNEQSSKIYKFYMIITLTLIGIFTILNMSQMVYDSSDIELLVSHGVLFFAGISILGKTWSFMYYRQSLNLLMNSFESSSLLSKTQDDSKLLQKENKLLRRIILIYFLTSSVAAAAAVTEPLLDFFLYGEDLSQPFFNYFFLKACPQWFSYLTYLHQTFVISIYVLIDVGTDGFFWVCLNATIFEIKMLKERLLSMNLNSGRVTENCEELKICFLYYQRIVRIVKLLNTFSITVFIQFGMLSLTICFSLLSFVKPEMTNFSVTALAPFLAVTTTQLLLPCWLGSTMLYESEKLTDTVYFCDWLSQNQQNRKFFILFMERLKAPVIVNIGKVFPLTLNTFIGIMKASYSFYTLLIYTTNKQKN